MIYSVISTHIHKLFKDRSTAGKMLANRLLVYADKNTIVVALPRGGVPVAFEVAKIIGKPLTTLVSRKIGAPGQNEYGIGAVSEKKSLVLDKKNMTGLGLKKQDVAHIIDAEEKELNRRVKKYRDDKPLPDLTGKTVILIDDGLATGVTAKAAIKTLGKLQVKKIIFAAPVCALQSLEDIKEKADVVVCLHSSPDLRAIGFYYTNFDQITDDEVVELLGNANKLKH